MGLKKNVERCNVQCRFLIYFSIEGFCIFQSWMKNMYNLRKLLRLICFAFSIVLFAQTVYAQPGCSFTLVRDSGCIPLPILATATDNDSTYVRQWTLTNCGTGTVVNTTAVASFPSYSYVPTQPGCYCLTLWARNQQGQTCTSQTCNIVVSDTPVASMQIFPTSFCAPRDVTLNLTCNNSCGGIDETRIQWGCGNISTFAGCPGTATHTYGSNCNAQCFDVNVVLKNSCGCFGTKKFSSAVCVLPAPRANFTADVTSGVCLNSLTTHFTADNAGPNYTYCWYIDGVQQQCGPSLQFTHTFPANNTCSTIKLKVFNAAGCVDSIQRDNLVCVFSQPNVTFSQDTNSLCIDSGRSAQLCLHNTSFPLSNSARWYVTGGSPQVTIGPVTGDDPCITLTNPGQYSVTLIGDYGAGCVDTAIGINIFSIKRNPEPCFYALDTNDCRSPFTANFVNCSNAPVGSTYNWQFGLGSTPAVSNQQNPGPVTYTGFGKRDVQLTITAPNGCAVSLKKMRYIQTDTTAPSFTVAYGYGCVPKYATTVSTTAVYAGQEPVVGYSWEVFLGNTLIGNGYSAAYPHQYTVPGCYNVRLTCWTATGCTTTAYKDTAFCLGEPPSCTLTAGPDTMCYEADSVVFNVSCTDNYNGIMAHFGDEGSPDAAAYYSSSPVIHTYLSFGEFDAWLVPSQDSCYGDTLRKHIVVLPPAANFSSSTSCLSGDQVCFNNLSNGAQRYHWSFGCAPDTFNTTSPCLILPHCDTCTVKLTAYNDITGCVHTKQKQITTACSQVQADFSYNPPNNGAYCGYTGVTFQNTTPGANQGQTIWDWNTANGLYVDSTLCVNSGGYCSVGVSSYRSLTYGSNTVAMIYTAPGGCRDTVIKDIKICNLNVNFTPDRVCLPDSFRFRPIISQPSAYGCDSIVRYKWSFDNGDTSALKAPVYYLPFGQHPVTLTVTNAYGCTATVTKTVSATTPVYINYSVDTILCPGSTIYVNNTTSSGANLTETWYFPGSTLAVYQGHQPPYISYLNDGDFPLIYSVQAGSCSRSDTLTVHVHDPILSGYLTANYTACPNPPFSVCGINTSLWVDSNTDAYTWNFGNGEYVEINPCDFYSFPGRYPVYLSVITNNGCRDTVFIDSVIVDGPYGTISHSPRGICACEDTVDFIVSTIKATQLTFVSGCNQGFQIINPISPVGTEQNPHYYDFHIPYCITDSCLPQLTFGDQTGCQVLLNDSFVYVDSPQIHIDFNNYGICLSGNVNFFDATTYKLPSDISYNVAWSWDFGDPNDPTPSTQQNPSHYYSQPGAFPVTFRVTSNFGCYDSIVSTSVVVIPKFPIVGFYADAPYVCAEEQICFHDTSYVDSITGPQFWYWDFGDGTRDSVSGPNPCHTYAQGGFYTVHLCLYDSIGCGDCDSSFVMEVKPKPIADAGPDTVYCRGVQTQLNGSGAASCQWSPAGLVSNPNICNPFTTVNSDTAYSLIVTDAFGCYGVDTVNILAGYVTAGFTLPVIACQVDSVCVTDTSTNVNGVITIWTYDFGDGNTLQEANVCNKYATPGQYNVLQTVTDNHGCVDTATGAVTVFPQPQALFSLNDTTICSDKQMCFTDLSNSISVIQTWDWNFGPGQGTYSGANPPCHLFTPPYLSNYPIQLIVSDQNGCFDTAIIDATVFEIPQANFTSTVSCEDENMPLTSTSVEGDGAIDACEWLLWIGAPTPVLDNNCNTSFMFPPGQHDVQLAIHDLNGCVDTIVKTVYTDSLSQLIIYPGDTTVCIGTSVDYTIGGVFDNIVWSPNVWVSNPYSSVVTITPLGNIGYIVSAVNGVCDAVSDTFTVRVIQKIPIEVKATPDNVVLGLSSSITSQIPGQIDSIVWTPDGTLDCSVCPNPVATPTQTTTYYATIYYSENGITCTNMDSVTITVLNSCNESVIYVPNTFTPNGDGINDIFMIRGIAASKVNYFRIFDRWGQLVFEAHNGAANETYWGWDGTNQRGEKLNPAVFVYTYEIECINHEVVTGKGNVTLVR
jgi:gliding motility-associated-like protein